jgi:hypothetical protein
VDAFDEAAGVLMRLAARLRDAHGADGEVVADSRTGADSAGPVTRQRALGARQAAVLELPGLEAELGLAAREVADALGYAAPNATNLLKRLEDQNRLHRVPAERPARWRLPRPAANASRP